MMCFVFLSLHFYFFPYIFFVKMHANVVSVMANRRLNMATHLYKQQFKIFFIFVMYLKIGDEFANLSDLVFRILN